VIDAAGQNNDQRSTLPMAVAVGRDFPAVVGDCVGWEMVVLTRYSLYGNLGSQLDRL
jgi:hypothetical protein